MVASFGEHPVLLLTRGNDRDQETNVENKNRDTHSWIARADNRARKVGGKVECSQCQTHFDCGVPSIVTNILVHAVDSQSMKEPRCEVRAVVVIVVWT